ncbi:ribonuclease VapC [Thermus composti]|uniref:Ribonuclease VapC n=1 Tax=Thermus composti TaxID=532059 RepID=A0ABV6PYQ8_9DEIN|nr:type II toxin-antitoxin system VapC family toxin [Thermus composti]GGM93283.1 ribonuclease VapC [Thermus composti]
MVLLDTNVLSEFIRPQPAEQVVAWLDRQNPEEVWVSAISRAEMELGLALMPEGKRKAALVKAVRAMFEEDFAGRCLPFDEVAAVHYGRIVADRQREVRPISVEDAQIAAIALAHGMVLATRNLADFSGIEGLRLVNPWEA